MIYNVISQNFNIECAEENAVTIIGNTLEFTLIVYYYISIALSPLCGKEFVL